MSDEEEDDFGDENHFGEELEEIEEEDTKVQCIFANSAFILFWTEPAIKAMIADDDKVTLTAHRYKSFLFTGI